MFESNDYMSSSEKLVAFLDGELPQEETTTLFYELAQNSDLQDEMRQFVHLRNNLRNTQVVPLPHLKKNILTNIGLKEGPMTTLMDTSSKAMALLIALFYNRVSLSIFLVAILSVGTIFLLNEATDNDELSKSPLDTQNLSVADISNIPVMESSIAEVSNNSGNQQLSRNNNTSGGSNINNTKSKSYTNSLNNNNLLASNSKEGNLSSNDLNATYSDDRINNNEFHKVLLSQMNDFQIPFGVGLNPTNRRRIVAVNEFITDLMKNTTIYINKFGAQSYPEFSLPGENNPIFNDIRIGLKYKFADNHSIGLAGGLENFLMTFDKEDADGIIYRYDQSWNGWWIGLTYHYNFGELMNSGLYPEINLLAGSTPVGPLLRGGLGMNYFLTEDFYLNFGFEAGSMIFNQEQFSGTSKWYSTEKLGFTIGVGVGL